ncbi:kinase-like domain-containing protein [Podospora appendiculata]|uniref:Kinase-like domain-containing protein n=1 Tax=Podospora appendiculata TaxID=314037 RepID=A0AAE0X0H4_9PEZI|nr:kinase-like domain-containing protein [Podospora appendiculata]
MMPHENQFQVTPTDVLTGTELFALFAEDEDAMSIIDLNPDFEWRDHGRRTLVFRTDRPSKKAGYVATFGRHAYHNDHCIFFFAKSGELILRDLSARHTNIEVENATREEQDAYAIQSDAPSSHRQRVIPRMARKIHIVIGTGAVFFFQWVNTVAEGHAASSSQIQRQLIQHAHTSAVPDMTPSMPDDEDTESVPVYGTRAQFAPRKYHNYAVLGAGTYGTVRKVVDLKTGELWAVKSINIGPADDRYRIVAFKQKVELLSQLRHPNILNPESFQDFTVDGRFDIFTPAPRREPSEPPAAAHRGLIHRDIKPSNILYSAIRPGQSQDGLGIWLDGGGPPELHFVIGDFGQARFQDGSPRAMGTLMYAAPEIVNGEVYPESDVWSFAVTLLQVLGYICPAGAGRFRHGGGGQARGLGRREWNEDRLRMWCQRLVTLVQGERKPASSQYLGDGERVERKLMMLEFHIQIIQS